MADGWMRQMWSKSRWHCIITSISRDHTEYLGDTLEAIAGEKAGIIKAGVPVIYDASQPGPASVIAAKAKEMGSPAWPMERRSMR